MLSSPPGAARPQATIEHRLSIGAMFLFSAGVAIAWVVLYEINSWLFSDLHISGFISWIFLPAAIRMLAVMIGGWAGALGLFVGALLTNLELLRYEPFNVLVMAALSALGPLLAVYLCTRWLKLPNDLTGLQRSQLLVFAAVGAVFNAFPHNLYFYMTGLSPDAWSGILPMFVGDLVGALAVLYLASLSIRVLLKRPGIKQV
jgi:hypothetical protein